MFALFTIYTFVAAAWMELMIALGLFVLVYELQVDLLNPKITDLGYLAGTMFMVILPAAAVQITRQWYNEKQANERLKQEKLEAELSANRTELAYLKEQIRPHFLFNVLNNLYGLTLEKSDEAPDLVLKVTQMLEYMLYRSAAKTVPLDEELGHLANYIGIQKIRCGEKLNVDFRTSGQTAACHIPPMLLLPFVENSFKHGVHATGDDSDVQLLCKVKDGQLIFSIRNSIPQNSTDSINKKLEDNRKNKSQGLGLSNVKKRLKILYDDACDLNIEAERQYFQVTLSIPIKEQGNEDAYVEMPDY